MAGVSTIELYEKLTNPEMSVIQNELDSLHIDLKAEFIEKVQLLHPSCPKQQECPFIICISSSAPFDGFLILLDSKGVVIQTRQIGYIKSISLTRLLGDNANDCLILNAIKGTGTGIQEDRYNIFEINNNALILIWDYISYYKSFPREMAPQLNYEVRANYYFDDSAQNDSTKIILNENKYDYSVAQSKLILKRITRKTKIFNYKDGKYIEAKQKSREK